MFNIPQSIALLTLRDIITEQNSQQNNQSLKELEETSTSNNTTRAAQKILNQSVSDDNIKIMHEASFPWERGLNSLESTKLRNLSSDLVLYP